MAEQNQPNQNQPDSPFIDKSEQNIDSVNNGENAAGYLCYWQNVGYNNGDTICYQGRVWVCEFNGWIHYGKMC